MGRKQIALVATALWVSFANVGVAQEYPSRPIRLLQGFAAGGNADAIARVLANEMQKGLGQPVIVEARPGAGGNIASDATAKAPADGYTIVLLTTAHVISAALYKSLPFDPIKHFHFITTVSELPHFVVVNAKQSPFKTLDDLVSAAKAKPGALNFGTAGIGTGQHLNGELLNTSANIRTTHVPYRGDAAAVSALLAAEIDFIVAPLTAVGSNIEAGNLRALATTSGKPWPELPGVPPISASIPAFGEVMPWTGIATAAQTPKPIVDKLNSELRRVIALPEVVKRLRDFGGKPASSTPEQITDKVAAEIARWNRVIDAAKIPRQ